MALMLASFGSRVAEEEVESLHEYFVETEQWRRLLAGEVDIVFGSKGAGLHSQTHLGASLELVQPAHVKKPAFRGLSGFLRTR